MKYIFTLLWLAWFGFLAFIIASPIVPGPDIIWNMIAGATGWELGRRSIF